MNYERLELIGRGDITEVYRGRHSGSGSLFTIAYLKSEFCKNEQIVERFLAEMEICRRLDHLNIIRVHDLGRDDFPYAVMELMEGETLQERLRRGPLQPREAKVVVEQILSALIEAHSMGVVHRDIKPGNVFLRKDGLVKVSDFGMAAVADAVAAIQPGLRPDDTEHARYMSPEQIKGHTVTQRSDLYSLGIVLHEMLVGHVPFEAGSAETVMQQHLTMPLPPLPQRIPPQLRYVRSRMLQKDPAARFGTAHDVWEALEPHESGSIYRKFQKYKWPRKAESSAPDSFALHLGRTGSGHPSQGTAVSGVNGASGAHAPFANPSPLSSTQPVGWAAQRKKRKAALESKSASPVVQLSAVESPVVEPPTMIEPVAPIVPATPVAEIKRIAPVALAAPERTPWDKHIKAPDGAPATRSRPAANSRPAIAKTNDKAAPSRKKTTLVTAACAVCIALGTTALVFLPRASRLPQPPDSPALDAQALNSSQVRDNSKDAGISDATQDSAVEHLTGYATRKKPLETAPRQSQTTPAQRIAAQRTAARKEPRIMAEMSPAPPKPPIKLPASPQIRRITWTEKLDYPIVKWQSANVPAGRQRISRKGESGQRQVTAEVAYRDGHEVSRRTLAERIIKAPVPQIVLNGVAPPSQTPTATRMARRLQTIAYNTQTRGTASLLSGVRRVVRNGRTGARSVLVEVTYRDDRPVSQRIVSSRIVREPVAEVVLVGTARSEPEPRRRRLPRPSLHAASSWPVRSEAGSRRERKVPSRRVQPRRAQSQKVPLKSKPEPRFGRRAEQRPQPQPSVRSQATPRPERQRFTSPRPRPEPEVQPKPKAKPKPRPAAVAKPKPPASKPVTSKPVGRQKPKPNRLLEISPQPEQELRKPDWPN
jgi:serine/threonine protein kinase